MPLDFTDHIKADSVEYFTDNTELANNLKALLLVTDVDQGNYKRLMRRKVIEQRDFWNHADRLGPDTIGTLYQYNNHTNGFAWRQIFDQGAAATDNIGELANHAALKYLSTKLMHLNDTDESNQLLDAIIAADSGQALREAVVTPAAQSVDLLDINFTNTQDWAVDSDESVIEDEDLQGIKDYAVMTKVKFAIAKADANKKDALIALTNVADSTGLNAFFNSPDGTALGLGGLHNKIEDGGAKWFQAWQSLAAAKALELELAAENDIAKLRAFTNANDTVEFKDAANDLGAPYDAVTFQGLIDDESRHIQQQVSQSVAEKVITHYIGQCNDANTLSNLATNHGDNFLANVNALHAEIDIKAGNFLDTDEFKTAMQGVAARKVIFNKIDAVTLAADNRNKRLALLALVKIDTATPDGKTAFRDALKNGSLAAALLGWAADKDGVIDAAFEGNDTLYDELKKSINEKVFALAVDKRGKQALDGHLYKIARWQEDADGDLHEDLDEYEFESSLKEQIIKANLSLEGTSLNRVPYSNYLETPSSCQEVQKLAANAHLGKLLDMPDADVQQEHLLILTRIAQCASKADYQNGDRAEPVEPESRPYTEVANTTEHPKSTSDYLFPTNNDFADKKQQALKKAILFHTKSLNKVQDLYILVDAANNNDFFDAAAKMLSLRKADGSEATHAEITTNLLTANDVLAARDLDNIRTGLQAQIAKSLIENNVLKQRDGESLEDYATRMKDIAGIDTPANVRQHIKDNYGFKADAVIDDDCNAIKKQAAFNYLQSKLSALQTNTGNAQQITNKLNLAKWLADAARNGNFSSVANHGDPIAMCDSAAAKLLLGVNPDKQNVNVDPGVVIPGGEASDTRILKQLHFNDATKKNAIVDNATQQAAFAAIRSQLDPINVNGFGNLIALQTALKGGNLAEIGNALNFGGADAVMPQALREKYTLADGSLNTPKAREALQKQVNVALFEFALLSANEQQPADTVLPNGQRYDARACTLRYTGHRPLVKAFADMSLAEQNKIMNAVIRENAVNPKAKPYFRQITDSANPVHIKKHLKGLGFEPEYLKAQEEGGPQLSDALAKDNESLYHKIYNHKVAKVLQDAGISLDENQITRLNRLFYQGGNINVPTPPNAQAKTADAILGNLPAVDVDGVDNARAQEYKVLVGLIHDAIDTPPCGKTKDEVYDLFGVDRGADQYANDQGRQIRNTIYAIHNNNTHLLTKRMVASNDPALAGAAVEQQGKEFIEFLLAQDTSNPLWTNINTTQTTRGGVNGQHGDAFEALGLAFAQAKDHKEFKEMLKTYLPRDNHGAVFKKGPFHLPGGINGRNANEPADITLATNQLPTLLRHNHADFITAKQFGRLKSLQAAQTIKNYDQDGAQDSLKQGIKHFEESIKDAGGDAFEKVHSSSHSLFSTTGYGVDLRALVKNPNEDEVFHVLPGHKNAESAQEKNSFYKAQLERLEKLRRDHENLLAKYNQFIEQCEVRGYDRSADNKTSKELDSLVAERAKIDGRLKLLNIAIPKFEKAVKDTQRVIDHDIAAVVKGAVRNKGVTHEGKDIKTLIARARREDSSKYSDEELNNPTVLEATSSQNTPYPFGVANKAKIGKIAEIEIQIKVVTVRDNNTEWSEGTYRKAYVEQVHDFAAVNGKRDRTYCAGEPKAENEQELYSYAFNVVANDLANMDVKPGKKHPLTKTPVRYIIHQNDPDKAKAYFAAAIYHGVAPKHIKVISNSFSTENTDVYTKSWGTVKLNEQYKTRFDNVHGSPRIKEVVDSAQAVKRPNTLRNRVFNKPKTEEGKQARQKQVDLEKGVEQLKRSSDKVSSDADKNLDDAVSGNNPNAKDEDYTGIRLR